MATGLEKFAGDVHRRRGSSPKLLVFNNALVTALAQRSFLGARRDPESWGRLVESAVGAHLLNTSLGTGIEVLYWRDRNREVDFECPAGCVVSARRARNGRAEKRSNYGEL